MILLLLISLCTLQLPVVAAQNCSSCNAVADGLGKCYLPDLGTNWTEILKPPQYRNVTGVSFGDLNEQGPITIQLTNYTQANCLCKDYTASLAECTSCLNQTVANFTIQDSYRRNAAVFLEDCNSFGYYPSSTLAWPSTTRASTPSETATKTECLICGIVDGQLKSCNLPLLTGTPPKGNTTITDQYGTNYTAYLLFDRKAGECLCTVPVLSLFSSCRRCVGQGNPRTMVDYYRTDCHSLGYWTEAYFDSRQLTYQKPLA